MSDKSTYTYAIGDRKKMQGNSTYGKDVGMT